jgi:hypothetical protein
LNAAWIIFDNFVMSGDYISLQDAINDKIIGFYLYLVDARRLLILGGGWFKGKKVKSKEKHYKRFCSTDPA